MRAPAQLLVPTLLLLLGGGAGAMPRWLTFYGDDPANQHAWSNLGHTGRGRRGSHYAPQSLLDRSWCFMKYKIPVGTRNDRASDDPIALAQATAASPVSRPRGAGTAGTDCCTSRAGPSAPTRLGSRRTAATPSATAALWAGWRRAGARWWGSSSTRPCRSSPTVRRRPAAARAHDAGEILQANR